jgi:hypothetical protein
MCLCKLTRASPCTYCVFINASVSKTNGTIVPLSILHSLCHHPLEGPAHKLTLIIKFPKQVLSHNTQIGVVVELSGTSKMCVASLSQKIRLSIPTMATAGH